MLLPYRPEAMKSRPQTADSHRERNRDESVKSVALVRRGPKTVVKKRRHPLRWVHHFSSDLPSAATVSHWRSEAKLERPGDKPGR